MASPKLETITWQGVNWTHIWADACSHMARYDELRRKVHAQQIYEPGGGLTVPTGESITVVMIYSHMNPGSPLLQLVIKVKVGDAGHFNGTCDNTLGVTSPKGVGENSVIKIKNKMRSKEQ